MNNNEILSTNTKDKVPLLEKNLLKKKTVIYLAFVYGFVLICWSFVIILPEPANKAAYNIMIAVFSLFPFLSNLLTRIITKDKSSWMMKPNFKKSWKIYLISAFIPGILIFLGAVIYFLIFPNHLDLSMTKLIETYGKFGVPSNLPHTVGFIIKLGIIGVFISPLILPVEILALGEEIGWRAYLLPILLKLMNKQKAILLNGVLWGLCHAPLIYFGFNYGLDYWGAPYTGILMMTLLCAAIGVWLSYVTIRSNSVIPACILHGTFNVTADIPVLIAISGINTLWGPNPTGIIGMLGFIIGAIILLRILPNTTKEE